MIRKVINYIKEEEFKLNIINNKINIVNYTKIVILEEDKIVISHNKGNITITGEGLIIKKLLDNELLIVGNIKTIELR